MSGTIKSQQKKQELLEMALRGDPKPARDTPLWNALHNYSCTGNACYDPEFVSKIRASTSWLKGSRKQPNVDPRFIDGFRGKRAPADKKAALLEMAKDGQPRPPSATPAGQALSGYTSPNHGMFDIDFVTTLRVVRPDWLEDPVAKKKTLIMEAATSGQPRSALGNLACALQNYVRPSSGSFDGEFRDNLMALRPDWFPRASRK
jgi:hypothetical protein